MISKNAQLDVKLINEDCKIVKIFGENNFYSYELKDFLFSTKMLQFISGKEYTFVLEIKVDESKIKPGDILLDINFIYDDILTKEKKTINAKFNWVIKDLNFAKANEEYIRSQTYDVLERAIKLRESNKVKEGQNILKEMRVWLEKNYHGTNKVFLEDIKKAEPMFESVHYDQRGITYTTSQVRQMQSKRIGTYNMYSNSVQMRLQSNYNMSYARTQNLNNMNNNQYI